MLGMSLGWLHVVCGLGSACQVVKGSCGSGQFGYGLGFLGV